MVMPASSKVVVTSKIKISQNCFILGLDGTTVYRMHQATVSRDVETVCLVFILSSSIIITSMLMSHDVITTDVNNHALPEGSIIPVHFAKSEGDTCVYIRLYNV